MKVLLSTARGLTRCGYPTRRLQSPGWCEIPTRVGAFLKRSQRIVVRVKKTRQYNRVEKSNVGIPHRVSKPLFCASFHGAGLKSHHAVHDTRCKWSKHVFAVDMSSVGTLTCVGESVVGMIHSFNLQRVVNKF